MKNENIDYEIWVEAYKKEDLEVSNHGRIRGTSNRGILMTFKPEINTDVFKGMTINYWQEPIFVSEIMAETFLNDLYFRENKKVIKFRDGNRFNNHLNNLELITDQERLKRLNE